MVGALIFDCYGVVLVDGSIDAALLGYIRSLKKRYKIGMLSNVNAGKLQQLIGSEILASHFDAALSSGDIGAAKPDARAFAAIAEALGVPPADCVMIDDTPAYCTAARRAGMEAIDYWSLPQLRRDMAALGVHADDPRA